MNAQQVFFVSLRQKNLTERAVCTKYTNAACAPTVNSFSEAMERLCKKRKEWEKMGRFLFYEVSDIYLKD